MGLTVRSASVTGATTAGRVLTTAEVDANWAACYLFTPSGSASVARTVASRLGDVVSVFDFLTTAQIADVQARTALVDVSAAITNAIAYANSIGATLVFPAGKYYTGTTTLVFKNQVRYVGAGKDSNKSLGTVISYAGTSDAIQINNPINSSTAANISIEDMWINCTQRTAGKAAIADVGSTYLTIKRVGVSGNDYGIILDQSELTDIDECDIELTAASSTAGIWLVNGAEHSVGANTQFTNRISIKKCQFNSAVGGTAIMDDGGVAHAFEDNNYNGCVTHIRSCGGTGISIRGGESEGATGTIVVFSNLTAGGTAKGASIGVEIGGAISLIPTAGQSCLSITSVGDITFGKTYMGNTTAVKVVNTSNANTIIDTGGIYNAGGGATFDGVATRHFELNPSQTLTGTATLKTNWQVQLLGKFYPATDAAASQTAAAIYAGTGVPNNANGSNGDFYFRSDGGAGTCIYQRRAGAWVATGA